MSLSDSAVPAVVGLPDHAVRALPQTAPDLIFLADMVVDVRGRVRHLNRLYNIRISHINIGSSGVRHLNKL